MMMMAMGETLAVFRPFLRERWGKGSRAGAVDANCLAAILSRDSRTAPGKQWARPMSTKYASFGVRKMKWAPGSPGKS